MDFRKISNISVNCVVFGFGNNGLQLLLSKRSLSLHDARYPDIDDWMIPGGHVFKSERLDESAQRIFKHFVGCEGGYFKQFRTFGNPERIKNSKDLLWMKCRDSNPRTASVAYYFLFPMIDLGELGMDAAWYSVTDLPELAFDHLEIITRACDDLRKKVMIEPLIFELLPDKFTLKELQSAYEAVLGVEIDNRNFRKKSLTKKYIIQLDEKRVGESKKPSSLYIFSQDVYEKTSDKRNVINI